MLLTDACINEISTMIGKSRLVHDIVALDTMFESGSNKKLVIQIFEENFDLYDDDLIEIKYHLNKKKPTQIDLNRICSIRTKCIKKIINDHKTDPILKSIIILKIIESKEPIF